MKKIIVMIALVTVTMCHSVTIAKAFYDPRTVPNNKIGVHILAPGELEDAAKLVNSHGGDWGYVTIPIQPSDRDKTKWQTFMHEASRLHLIPIVRITTIPQGGTWATGEDTDLVDFANFLNELDWPVENRYIVLFNEVNRSTEWGGTVDPGTYTTIVKNARTIFKERSENFFLLGPALDMALPNSSTSLSAPTYLQRMSVADPMVWSYFDGWAAHSYANPGFAAPAKKTGLQSIVSYKSEFTLLRLAPKPVFITETGWDQTKVPENVLKNYWEFAWNTWENDKNVVAVTPFVLQGGEQFAPFSLYNGDHHLSNSGTSLDERSKVAGQPRLNTVSSKSNLTSAFSSAMTWDIPFFRASRALLKLENVFRVVLGLPVKSAITLSTHNLLVETAQNAAQWEKGLSDRENLGSSDGMLFIFPQLHIPIFWMKDMHFPIDIIWIRENQVVDISPNLPVPASDKLPTYSPKVPVNTVLEVPAGWTEANNIVIGDKLTIN